MNRLDTALKLKNSGNFSESEKIFRSLLKNNPKDTEVRLHLGNTLVASGQLKQGINELKKNLQNNPQHILTAYNLGCALFISQHFHEALVAFTKALDLKPDLVDARINRGSTFHALGLLDYAIEDFNQALIQAPEIADTHWNRALTLLTMGNYNEGWQEYEWRWKRASHKRTYPHQFKQPQWDGTAFPQQRLLVYSEQGLGDSIQFARFLPLVKSLGGELIFEIRPELAQLFGDLDGPDKITIFSPEKPPTDDFDFQISLMSLPLALDIKIEELPPPTIIKIDSAKKEYWNQQLDSKKINIGLVWAGRSTHTNDCHRSLPLTKFNNLANLNNIQFYGLQTGAPSRQINTFANPGKIRNCAPTLTNFTDTAAIINELDLVISVDTAVAHLSASLAKPTWILLSFVPDWRWQRSKQNSQWYSSVHLFRQPRPGDWENVFNRLKLKLIDQFATFIN